MKPHPLYHPYYLLSLGETLLPWTMGIAIIGGCVGLVWGLVYSPPDYHQGEIVRIMYIHVPASWGGLAVYTVMAISSAWGLIMRAPGLHLLTKSVAPVGLAFTAISLATGAIWGKPAWGAWWVWDARLTSMLLLVFLYMGYWTLVTSGRNEEKALSAGAVIALVGWINIPVIKWSVEWWHTLHQPASVFRLAKPAIHWTMMFPLLCTTLALAAYGFSITVMRFRLELARRKVRGLQIREQSFSGQTR